MLREDSCLYEEWLAKSNLRSNVETPRRQRVHVAKKEFVSVKPHR